MTHEQNHSDSESVARPRSGSGQWLTLVGILMMSWAALLSAPARADNLVQYADVACGSGLILSKASGVPAGSVHGYVFKGVCSLRSIFKTGPWVEGHPPVVATARWEESTGTYSESIHLLAPVTIDQAVCHDCSPNFSGEVPVSTKPEEATFKCDVDPVIHAGPHCTVVNHYNATGWGDQHDGFAWSAVHNRPLLAGRATAKQAAAMSQRTASHASISCRGLHLTDATGVPSGKKRTYKFNGTCQLYHSMDGSGGLQVTHVLVHGSWDSVGQQAKEGVTVLTAPNQGGGGWSTTYTCTGDPWLNGHAHCSKTARLGRSPQVYEPITDIADRHPVALGMVNAKQAARLSEAHQGKPAGPGARPKVLGFGHHGGAKVDTRAHAAHLGKPKLQIQYATAVLDRTCRADRLVELVIGVRNIGGPLPARTRYAYVHVAQSGGAGLNSSDVELPALRAGQTWTGHIVVGTNPANLSRLPGSQMLLVSIGPRNADQSKLAFYPPPMYRTTLLVPAGYCQPQKHVSAPSQMHLNSGGTSAPPRPTSTLHRFNMPTR